MAKKRYINPKTGQISVGQSESMGTNKEYTPSSSGKTYHIPGSPNPVSAAEYKNYKEIAKMESEGGYKARSIEELAYRGLLKPTQQLQAPPTQTPSQPLPPATPPLKQEVPTIDQMSAEAQQQPITVAEQFGEAKGQMLAAGEQPLPAGTTRLGRAQEHGDRYKQNVLTSALAFSKLAFVEYDNLRALITGGDTSTVKDARQTFSAVSSALAADIQDVAAGILPANAVIINLQRAVFANEVLARQLKGKNIENLRYWIRDGKDIEVEVELNRGELERMRRELLAAIEQSRLQQLYG